MDQSPFAVVERLRTLTDAVILGVSGGKDSVAVLDLMVGHGFHVSAYFMWLVEGLEFQERYLRYLERRYAIEIMRYPQWQLSRLLRSAAFRPYGMAAPSGPIRQVDIENDVRSRTGIRWLCGGQRCHDGIARNAVIKRCEGIDMRNRRAYPVGFWSTAAVLAYLRKQKIPLAPEYTVLGRSFGSLEKSTLPAIKKEWPDDWEKILKVFPFAEAQVKRREMFDVGR